MKKVIFCLRSMVLGGVEKELITVLKKLDPEKYQVVVLLLYIEDENIVREIPNWVQIINLGIDKGYYCGSTLNMIKERVNRGQYINAINLLAKWIFKIGTSHSNQSIDEIPILPGHYDIAICYHIHSPISLKYVAESINANKKIAWIHNDFSTTKYPIERLKPYLGKYHKFIAVSKTVRDEFVQRCPMYRERIEVIHNILDEKEIIEAAMQVDFDDSYFADSRVRILTVGRFTEQKGFDIAISICEKLKARGYKFCWYMIGWGPEEQKLKKMIEEKGLKDCTKILGERKNPYPYIGQCDIYVQPSRHEAWGLVIQEARILRRPIVCTNFAGADEQIINNETGIIVPIGDMNALENSIAYLIDNVAERERIIKNLELMDKNECRIERIEQAL